MVVGTADVVVGLLVGVLVAGMALPVYPRTALSVAVGGVAVLVAILGWSRAGCFTQRRHLHVTIGGAYWHFVDVVWLFLFVTIYVWGGWGAPIAAG